MSDVADGRGFRRWRLLMVRCATVEKAWGLQHHYAGPRTAEIDAGSRGICSVEEWTTCTGRGLRGWGGHLGPL